MRYKIDVQGLQGLDDDLLRLARLFPQAARKGLAEGARAARRRFLKLVFDELTLDKSKARQLVKPVRTTQKGAASFVISRQLTSEKNEKLRKTGVGLQHFEHQVTPRGVRFRISRKGGYEFIQHAFPWAHRGLFIRRKYQSKFGPASFAGLPKDKMRRGGRSAQTGLVFRLPIVRLQGRKVTSFLYHNEPRIMQEMEKTAFNVLNITLINEALKKSRAFRIV